MPEEHVVGRDAVTGTVVRLAGGDRAIVEVEVVTRGVPLAVGDPVVLGPGGTVPVLRRVRVFHVPDAIPLTLAVLLNIALTM